MIKRIVVGSLAAGIVLFLWGCAAWLFLPTYTNFKDILDEEAVVRTMNETLPEKGIYYFPKHPDQSQNAISDWSRKVSVGPTAILVYNPQGHGPLGYRKFGAALMTQWLVALLAAWLLAQTLASKPSFRRRWWFGIFIGCVISLAAYMPDLIWYGYPPSFTLNLIRDMLIGWVMAGFILAYFIKTPAEEKKEIKLEEKIKSEIRAKLHVE
jgi:hypothetical protein